MFSAVQTTAVFAAVQTIERHVRVGPDSAAKELSLRRTAEGEHRLPPSAAVAVAIAVYALLPGSLLFAPRIVFPIVEGGLLLAVVITDPRRVTRESRWSRLATIALAGIVIVTNLVALGTLIDKLTHPSTQGRSLLLAAMQVWLTNVIGFALLYWEIDRGGPVARRKSRRADLPPADWRFANDEDEDAISEVAATSSAISGWIPTFVDYLYLSLTNSSAFSPTDTMPLTTRAKVLMGIEATAALFTSLLVVARAVGSISGSG